MARFVIKGEAPKPEPPTLLWLKEDKDGNIHLMAGKSDDDETGDYYMLTIFPDGTIELVGAVPDWLGFQLDDRGRVAIREDE